MKNLFLYLITAIGAVILHAIQPITFGEPHPYGEVFVGVWEMAQQVPPLIWVLLLSVFATYMGTQYTSSLKHMQKFWFCAAAGAVFVMIKHLRYEVEMEGAVGFIKTIMVFLICFFAATTKKN